MASQHVLEAYFGRPEGFCCGGLVRYQQCSATLGPLVDAGGRKALLTVSHLFSIEPPQRAPLIDAKDNALSSRPNTPTLNEKDGEILDGLWDDNEYDDEYDEHEL